MGVAAMTVWAGVAVAETANAAAVRPGASVHGVLPSGTAATTFVGYTLGPGVQGPVTIEMRSLDFDALIVVSIARERGAFAEVGNDDDGAVGTDARFLLKADPKEVYRIEARARDDEWGGEFDLSLTAGTVKTLDESAKRRADEAYYHAVLERSEASRNVRRQLRILGWWSMNLSNAARYEEALAVHDRARALRAKLGPPGDESVGELLHRAVILRAQGSAIEAKKALAEAVDLQERIHGADDPDMVWVLFSVSDHLRELEDFAGARAALERALRIAERPDAGEVSKIVPKLWSRVAWVYDSLKDPKESERAYRASLAAAERIFGPRSLQAGLGLYAVSLFFKVQGRYAEAVDFGMRALQIQQSQPVVDPGIVFYQNNLGELYVYLDRNKDAEEVFLRTIALCDAERQRSEDPKYVSSLVKALGNLGNLYSEIGRYREAQPLLERAVTLLNTPALPETLFWDDVGRRSDASRRIEGWENLAGLYYWQDKYAESEPLCRKVLEMREKSLPADHPRVASSLGNLGNVLIQLGRAQEAVPLVTRALEIQEKRFGPTSPRVATQLERLASAYTGLDREPEAAVVLERVLAIREKTAPGSTMHGRALNDLALIYKHQDKLPLAEAMTRRALEISEKEMGPEHSETATTLMNLGILEAQMGHLDQAAELEQRALRIRRKAFGPTSPDVAHCLRFLGNLSRKQKRDDRAERYLTDALAMYEATLGTAHPDTALCRGDLVTLLRDLKRATEADTLDAVGAKH